MAGMVPSLCGQEYKKCEREGSSSPGSRQHSVEQMKIPLNLPLQRETFETGDFWTNMSCESNSSKVKLTYTLSDGRKIRKVTEVVTGTESVVRAVSFLHR
jgi:hypothetical protein